jgi:hypothetical protein
MILTHFYGGSLPLAPTACGVLRYPLCGALPRNAPASVPHYHGRTVKADFSCGRFGLNGRGCLKLPLAVIQGG